MGHAANVEDTTIWGRFVLFARAGQFFVQSLAGAAAGDDERRLAVVPEQLPDAPRDLQDRHGGQGVGEEDGEGSSKAGAAA